MSPLFETLLTTGIVTSSALVLLWLVATSRRDVSIVDVYWGTGFAIIAWIAIGLNRPVLLRPLLLATLTTVWAARLSVHLWRRKRGSSEDHRYAAMRQHHGRRFWWISFFTVFVLQAAILWFVSLPLQVAAVYGSSAPLGMLDVLGVVIWIIGFVFEAVGDRQLARFQANARNERRVLDQGLWRYTRHPNYFGDFCVWWGLYAIAAAGGAGWTVASPLLMSLLLMKVSGVTLLEQTITGRRPDYAAYQARTNAFFPGRPKPSR